MAVSAPLKRVFAVLVASLLLMVPVGTWLVSSGAPPSTPPMPAEMENRGAGVLDGRRFAGEVGLLGEPPDVEDAWTFSHGMFVSRECRERCGYQPAPYYTRRRDGAIEFTATSHCENENSTIVWRGAVRDGVIEGTFEWTAERWYWTIEREFWFRGQLAEDGTLAASGS